MFVTMLVCVQAILLLLLLIMEVPVNVELTLNTRGISFNTLDSNVELTIHFFVVCHHIMLQNNSSVHQFCKSNIRVTTVILNKGIEIVLRNG